MTSSCCQKELKSGRLCFEGFGTHEASKNAPFARIGCETDAADVWKLMNGEWKWKMRSPKLIISVTGGAQCFYNNQQQKEAFKHGIMKVASTPGADVWIITGGTKTGVMEIVGEAARDYMLQNGRSEQDIVLLGIATWGIVTQHRMLAKYLDENEGKSSTADYCNIVEGATTAAINSRLKQSLLDPHHTHFLLVDDGTEGEYGKEIEFRAKFEKMIRKSTETHTKQLAAKSAGCTLDHYTKTREYDSDVTCSTSVSCDDSDNREDHGSGSGRGTGNGTINGAGVPSESSDAVPMVLLVLEGGKGTLKTCREAINNGCPVVVIAGSGRIADVIAKAHQQRSELSETKFETRVRSQLKEVFKSEKESEANNKVETDTNECFNDIKEILDPNNEHLLTIYQQNTDLTIDHSIIYATIKANKSHSQKENFLKQLELTLDYRLVDIAKNELLIPKRRSEWEPNDLGDVLRSALLAGQHEFVSLLLNCGLQLKQFLTVDKLTNLYTEVEKSEAAGIDGIIKNLLCEAETYLQCSSMSCCCCGRNSQSQNGDDNTLKTWNTLKKVGRVVTKLMKDQRKNHYKGNKLSNSCYSRPGEDGVFDNKDKNTFVNPERELFLWSVLLNQKEMAMIFWKLGTDHIGAALTASRLMKSLAKLADEDDQLDLAQQLINNANEFETFATGILNECYQRDKTKAHKLLVRDLQVWGHKTLFQLADSAQLMMFMEHSCCQTLLNVIWKGRMAQLTPMWKICVGLVFPPILFLIKFDDDADTDTDSKKQETSNKMNAVYPDNNTTNNKHTSGVGLPHSIPPPGAPTQQTQHRRRLNRIQFFRAFYYFHTSPVVKFCYHTISNIVFLGLFSFFLLTDLRPHSPSVYEYIVWVWALTMFVEELRQFMSHDPVTIPAKLASYFRSAWNRFDQIVYLFFLVSVILRWSLDASNFVWARMFYASTLTLYFLRFLQVFFIEKKIGPKVIMIRRMVTDLAFFLLLLAVFLFSYGIAAQALMYPNSTPSWNILLNVVYFPYFSIYGDMNLDELQGDVPDCTNNATIYEDPNSGVPRCSEHSWLAVLMFAVYLLLTNILLINLLIAMFSYTFSKVQENSERMWRFYRFGLIYEYYDKSTLAPPLIILCHVWQIMVYIYQSCCRRTRERINTDFHKHLDVDSVEDKQLDVSDSTHRPTDKHQINGNNGNNGATQSTVQHKDKQLDVDSDRQLTAFERAGLNTFRQTPDQQEQWDNSVNTAGQRSNSSQQQQLNRLMNKLESMEQKMREMSDSLTKTNNTAITET